MREYTILVSVSSKNMGLKVSGLFSPENGFSLSQITYELHPRKIISFAVKTERELAAVWEFCCVNEIMVFGIRDDINHLTSYQSDDGRIITM